MDGIPLTSTRTIPFFPPSLKKDHPKVEFTLRVPNFQDRDELGIRLYQMGLKNVTTETVRSLMISEMFTFWDIERAEKEAAWLEGHWQNSEMDQEDMSAWARQEQQRLLDIAELPANADIPEMKEQPPMRCSVRDRAKSNLLVQEIVDASQPLRDKIADQQAYGVRYQMAMARMHILAVRGMQPPLKLAIEDNLVSTASMEEIRDRLARLGGAQPWKDLLNHVESLYALPEIERGNSVSPLGNSSEGNGSPAPSGELEPSAGPSTTSNIGRTRAGASRKTTVPSSVRSPGRGKRTGQKGGRTTGPSSSSPSA